MTELVALDADTIELIKRRQGGDAVKVINLVKSIERLAEEQSNDPFLVAMGERAGRYRRASRAASVTRARR